MSKSASLRVVGYVRVSSAEQAEEGVSLAAQDAKVRGYAALHDLDLAGVEVDAGVSAKSLDRPGLRRALAMLDDGRASGLVITKLDRLSRSVKDWNALIEGYFGAAAGRQLYSVGDSIDTSKAAGRLVLNVLMSVAQWEREAIGERTRDALAYKKAMGERTGGVPFGKSVQDDGRRSKAGHPSALAPDPGELETLGLMRGWEADGRSARSIAAELNVRGIPSKRGVRWSHNAVIKILAANQPRAAS